VMYNTWRGKTDDEGRRRTGVENSWMDGSDRFTQFTLS
jgi:hypothetical protein